MLHLFRQFTGRDDRVEPTAKEVEAWMDRHPSGLDPRIVSLRKENRDRILRRASEAGIPFFVNPYCLSLLHVRVPYYAIGADLAIRDYVLYREQLVDEFGRIVAWEKEDQVEPGKPNAAGWLLPSAHNLHRRHPRIRP